MVPSEPILAYSLSLIDLQGLSHGPTPHPFLKVKEICKVNYPVDTELVGWLQPQRCRQRLCVQLKAGSKWNLT